MLIILALTVFLAALYFARKWLMSEAKSLEADARAVETEVQNAVQVAEKVADGVVQEIKAKL